MGNKKIIVIFTYLKMFDSSLQNFLNLKKIFLISLSKFKVI